MNTLFTQAVAAKFTAFGLAAMVTLSILASLNGLAGAEHAAAQQMAQQQAAQPT